MQVKARAVPVSRTGIFSRIDRIVDGPFNTGTIFSQAGTKKEIRRMANFDVKTPSQWRISC